MFLAKLTPHSSPQASQAEGRPVTSPSPKEGGRLVASPASQAGNPHQTGQAGNQGNRSGRCRALQSSRETALPPRQTALVPGEATPQLTPNRPPLKGLPQKTLTISGSLTFPANL